MMMDDQQVGDCDPADSALHEGCCVICRDALGDDRQKVHKKGLDTLIRVSILRGDNDLHAYLLEKSLTSPIGNVFVHNHRRCRTDYTRDPEGDMRRATNSAVCQDASSTAKRLRSSLEPFDWMGDCFLCGKRAVLDPRHPGREPVSEVTLLGFRAAILKQCSKRDDYWAHGVLTRLNDCIDLVAAEARYHSRCYTDFYFINKSEVVGRPADSEKNTCFEALCHWLDEEGDTEKMTLSELHEKMRDLTDGQDVYGIKTLREKLVVHYGDHIFWSKVRGGRDDVLCFRNMASYIVHEQWHSEKRENIQLEAERIVRTCAKLLKEDIRGLEDSKKYYPSTSDIRDIDKGREFLSPLTRIFIETMIKDDVRRNSIGQALTQAARPMSIMSPILFGTAVEMDHVFGSKWLIEELFQLGFSVSHDELTLFKQSILQEENLCTLSPPPDAEITQWASDNADHDVRTIDGANQFHGMGTICMSAVHGVQLDIDQRVQRMARLKVSELIGNKGIPITQYIGPASPALSSVKFKPLLETLRPYIIPPVSYYANIVWQSARVFNKSSTQTPNYTGFMQHFFRRLDNGVQKCQVLILPFIDLNPNDQTCIYSTLLYINDQSGRLGQESASVTFDQPLWQKAVEIVEAKNLTRVVCRLGGFHLLMSACGSVCTIMKGSGLEEAMGEVYGANTVTHISTGKAISRALRAHFLVERALTTKLFSAILPTESEIINPESNNRVENTEKLSMAQVRKIEELNDRVSHDDSMPLSEVVESEELAALNRCIEEHKAYLSTQSRTAKLWILYLYYISVIKDFITCERTGDWEGHLTAVGKLLNLFAASGHINYAKSGRLYLQTMRELPDKHPWLYQKFAEGHHAIRRSNRFWAGLWTDLCIEQILMRSMKARGGLTRGRGMTESVRHQWVYGMHHCAAVHEAMTSLTNRRHLTSAQHIELGKSRCKRDLADLEKILGWFEQHDPFSIEVSTLRSLTTGITATEEDGINCDETEIVGQKIHQSLDGVAVNSAHIKRSDHVRTLNDLQPGIKIGKKNIHIEPSVLFMRCTALAQRESEDIKSYFKYELSAIPTALFKDYYMRKTDKAELARVMKKDMTDLEAASSINDSQLVIDGGWLLHRIRWKKNATYLEVAEQYESYLSKKYGLCCVVFDGYQGPSTKDHEHLRRASKRSADITVTGTAKSHKDQEAFFSNSRNKTQFIELLVGFLQSRGYTTKCSDGDADVLIVSTALEFARTDISVVVVAEDTDIYILLLHHWNTDMAEICIRKESKLTSQKKGAEMYSIRASYEALDPVVRQNILFIHAWSGCDTTSSTFGQGKTHLLKMFSKSDVLQHLAPALTNREKTATEVGILGMSVFCKLYGAKDNETSLNSLRHTRYQEMVARCNRMDPERLPPTERAAHYHSLRVHLQIMQWNYLNNECLDALEWGWTLENNVMRPIMTDLDAAPANVIKFICCKCKISNKKQCATNLCSCHKHGLKCVVACGGCRGESCHNKSVDVASDDEEEEDS